LRISRLAPTEAPEPSTLLKLSPQSADFTQGLVARGHLIEHDRSRCGSIGFVR
jgi:hypothetical protein